MADPTSKTDPAPHPDTPEWFLPHSADLRALVREVSGLVVNVKLYLGKTMELMQVSQDHERRLVELEKWHRDATATTGRHSTIPVE